MSPEPNGRWITTKSGARVFIAQDGNGTTVVAKPSSGDGGHTHKSGQYSSTHAYAAGALMRHMSSAHGHRPLGNDLQYLAVRKDLVSSHRSEHRGG
jgi:hypothetical protein